jgi:exodeoxyribonuclease VII large subunit
MYFVLKDAQAQVRCVMFRSRGPSQDREVREGAQVEVQGLVTLYEARGEFQLIVESMRLAGRGALHEAFLRLRDRLQGEGLFDEALKKPLPFLPATIGVITSLQAAALLDVLTTLRRRNPAINVVVYPGPVQGPDAAPRIANALSVAGRRSECDVLLLCRGGGSIEDLWPFNEEAVARAIRACPLPVVCGVGHETDFTIADFAADRRAPTPTGAAELVSPVRSELLSRVLSLAGRMSGVSKREFLTRAQTLDYLTRRLSHPAQRLKENQRLLGHLKLRLARSMAQRLEERAWQASMGLRRLQALLPHTEELRERVQSGVERLGRSALAFQARHQDRLQALAAGMEHLSPARVLERGYCIVKDSRDLVVRDASMLPRGSTIRLQFAQGRAKATVDSIGD